jgi:type IV secretory pathway VirB10-like protein
MSFGKKYPHTITLRKGFIAVIGMGFILLMIYVVYLVSNSSKTKFGSHDQSSTIHKYPTDTDIPSALKSGTSTQKNANRTIASKISALSTPQNTAQTISNTQNLNQDDTKDMSAPINSNQITLDTNASSNITPTSLASSNASSPNRDDQNLQGEKKAFLQISGQPNPNDYLGASSQSPISKYEVQAGSIIPCILISGINSDLPGQITAQVRSNVYDSVTGNYLLIPQGARLVSLYDSQIAYGQERVLIAWNRIIFPNGKSIDLDGMPGIDLSGYAGFNDEVNNHYFKIFSSVLLMSALSAGAQLSQPQQSNTIFTPPTVGQTLAQSLGTNISNTGNMIAQKDLNIQPTLVIRPGYEFNISVTKDMVFPMPYTG